jgi:hypothetical protein
VKIGCITPFFALAKYHSFLQKSKKVGSFQMSKQTISRRVLSVFMAVVMVVSLVPTMEVGVSAMTAQSAVTWLANQVGDDGIDLDGNGIWCVDLANYYFRHITGDNRWVQGNGINWGTFNSTATQILESHGWVRHNWPSGVVPQMGDVICTTNAVPGQGHVGIVESGNRSSVVILDQGQNTRIRRQTLILGGTYQPQYIWRPNFSDGTPPIPENADVMALHRNGVISSPDFWNLAISNNEIPSLDSLFSIFSPLGHKAPDNSSAGKTVSQIIDEFHTAGLIASSQHWKTQSANNANLQALFRAFYERTVWLNADVMTLHRNGVIGSLDFWNTSAVYNRIPNLNPLLAVFARLDSKAPDNSSSGKTVAQIIDEFHSAGLVSANDYWKAQATSNVNVQNLFKAFYERTVWLNADVMTLHRNGVIGNLGFWNKSVIYNQNPNLSVLFARFATFGIRESSSYSTEKTITQIIDEFYVAGIISSPTYWRNQTTNNANLQALFRAFYENTNWNTTQLCQCGICVICIAVVLCECGECDECRIMVLPCECGICETCLPDVPDTSANLYISTINATQNGGWLEIHNPTDTAISTKGFYLSNDYGDLFLWQMPAVIIREGQTVRVRANSNTVDVVLKRLTTNFDFNVGNTLYLSDATGQILSLSEIV